MDKNYLLLKRASASRPSGQWNDDDFDVLANDVVVGLEDAANNNAIRHHVEVVIVPLAGWARS
jgi:hypothetical protein